MPPTPPAAPTAATRLPYAGAPYPGTRRQTDVAVGRPDDAARASAARAPDGEAPLMSRDSIWVRGAAGLMKLRLCDVEWVQAQSDYVLLHTGARRFMIRGPLSVVASMFASDEMIRAHRSALVRSSAVVGLTRPMPHKVALRLESGAEIRVGPTYRAGLLAALEVKQPRP